MILLANKLQQITMSQFKYDNYDEQFEDNPSNIVEPNQNSNPQESREPETFKVLVKQNKSKYSNQSDVGSSRKLANPSSVNNNAHKGVEQHLKLRSQLQELAQKMDQIIEKQRQRKKNKNRNNVEDDERIVGVKKELKQQQLQIQKNKTEIARLRKNMDSKYDMNRIVDKENELKHLKKQLHTLQQEKQSLEKIRKTQDKAIRGNQDKESINKKSRMEDQLKQLTQRTKKQTDTINESERHIRKLHEQLIVKEAKLKEYQARLKGKKVASHNASSKEINMLQQELKELEQQRVNREKEGNEHIRILQRQKKDLKHELERRKLIFEEKEKQLRLNHMKHKQIIRLINSSQNTHNTSVAESRVSRQSGNGKRTINKQGRQAPKIQAEYDQDFEEAENTENKVEEEEKPKKQKKSAVQKHDYGFSANLENDDDIIAEV